MIKWHLFVLVLAGILPSFLLTPVSNAIQESQQISDEEVKELESLRVDQKKPNITNPPRPESAQPFSQGFVAQAATSSPEAVPNSRGSIFRHRGITQAKRNKYWGGKPSPVGETVKGSVLPYAPADLAWYILSTGDEEGVAVVVEELVRIGMVGRADAINYLQDVKQILNYMKEVRDQMQNKKVQQFENAAYSKLQFPQRLSHLTKEIYIPNDSPHKREPESASVPTSEAPHPTTEEPIKFESSRATPIAEDVKDPVVHVEDNNKKRSHGKDTYEDFTLEVIYKLAKDMFTQSILRDDPTAEDTLSGLVTFLESKVDSRRILPEMKEKVLLIVSEALLEALQEGYQNSMPSEYMPEIYRKLATEGRAGGSQLSPNSRQKSS